MLRLFASRGFHELLNYSDYVASYVTKRQLIGVLPASGSVCQHRGSVLSRHLTTGSLKRKDALTPNTDQTGESETIDLDMWKSVMRAQAAPEEKQHVIEEEGHEPGGDSKDCSNLEEIRNLVAMWRLAGKFVPQEMTDEQVRIVAGLTTKSSRKKFLKFLALKEATKASKRIKKERKKEAERPERDDADEEQDDQGKPLLKNTFLLRFWDRSLDQVLGWRCAQSMRFGQPLVFDMSYESNMNRQNLQNTVSQLKNVEAWNRRAVDPFHLHYCNLQPDSSYMKELHNVYSVEGWERLLITSTDRQYVDLFPRDRLVYLTADSPKVLRTFDHSKVYVIGAIVDRTIQTGLSLANAKRLKLETARLPLDEFLHWQIGSKCLTLDQMMKIMLSIKDTGKWEEALSFVPTRKHDGFHEKKGPSETYSQKVRGDASHGPRKEWDRPFVFRENTFRSTGHKANGFISQDGVSRPSDKRENKPPVSRIRTSFNNSMKWRNTAGKGKMWDNE